MAEYDSKYAEALLSGLRFEGKTEIECCLEWGILYSQYKKWIEEIPEFTEAHEFGEMQYAAFWHNMAKNLAQKGNASILVAGMKNLSIKNWVDKKEAKEEQEVPVKALEITILRPRDEDDDSED
jgi:hypothetical protein